MSVEKIKEEIFKVFPNDFFHPMKSAKHLDETSEVLDYAIKQTIKEVTKEMLADRGAVFEQTKSSVLVSAFTYLDNYGGEDLQLQDIEEWFDKAKSEVIKNLAMSDVNVGGGENGNE